MESVQPQSVCGHLTIGKKREWRASEINVTRFTSSQSLTLAAFSCTKYFNVDDGTWAYIEIVEMNPLKSSSRKVTGDTRIYMKSPRTCKNVVFPESYIGIEAGLTYEIRVTVEVTDPSYLVEYSGKHFGHGEEIVLKNGAVILFDSNCGMVDQLFFVDEPISEYSFARSFPIPIPIVILITFAYFWIMQVVRFVRRLF